MTKKKIRITASELLKRLEEDPSFKKITSDRAKKFADRREKLSSDVSPLLKELDLAGISVDSPWGMIGKVKPNSEAYRILLAHLDKPYLDRNLEGIARALGPTLDESAWHHLHQLYEGLPANSGFKNGIADALSASMSQKNCHESLKIVKNKQNGPSRQLFVDGLFMFFSCEVLSRELLNYSNDREIWDDVRRNFRKYCGFDPD